MTRFQLIWRSLIHHRRVHLAVALGVAAATAVLTGALLVGDSVRGSLRRLTLERLGRIQSMLVLDRFFRQELVTEFRETPEFTRQFQVAAPAILFPQATIERRSGARTTRASSVLVLGCDESFWKLDIARAGPQKLPAIGEVILNRALAEELQAAVDDEVTLRLPNANQVPADSPLANKNDRIRNLPNLKVVAIVPAEGLGRFSLQASQSLPLNAFVSVATLQDALEQPDKINAVFVGDSQDAETSSGQLLSQSLRPRLADFSIIVKPVQRSFAPGDNPPVVAFEYYTVTTDRMIFDPEMSEVIERVLKPLGGQPALTYLANSIERGVETSSVETSSTEKRPSVPYSMITAIDFTANFRLTGTDGQPIAPLRENEIVLNSWTAENLDVQPGDKILVRYFEPETTHGEAVERATEFVLKSIAPLTKPARPYQRNRPAVFRDPPTLANDPDLTPEVRGVTDQETIDEWDAPFPFDYQRVRREDEEYWNFHRTTPKAFISYAAGKQLLGSRFGNVTSFRVPANSDRDQKKLEHVLEAELQTNAKQLGFDFQPIRQRQLEASRGTTPFDVLFLALSMFVIAAALLMVMLLFRLGIDQRATEIGTLLAIGFTRKSLGRLFVAEGFVVSAVGAVLGILVGIGYARLMLAGLTTWWLGAISAPFLQFHWTPRSLLLGYWLGVLIAALTIAWAVRQTGRISVRSLLAGQAVDRQPGLAGAAISGSSKSSAAWHTIQELFFERLPLVVPLIVAVLLAVLATQLGGMAQAGAFVGGGAALLVVLLLFVRRRLRRHGRATKAAWESPWLLWSLAERSAARNASRSMITIALMATATFLIVAMSSFRLAPTERGVGGFRFIAQSAEPIYADLNKPASWQEFFGSNADAFKGATILGLRVRPGDDASCQNLYQSTQPRVLGVTSQVIDHFDSPQATPFVWAGSAGRNPEEQANPWRLLKSGPVPADSPIPTVLDKNTALYSLHLYRGIGEEFEFSYDGRPIRFRVVGLLENSILQGSLLISESDFRQRFASISGFRYFLIGTPAQKGEEVAALLEDRFGDQGFDVTPARDVLEQLLAVQNTYLSTFQSLGALGLLLGALGLATVQLRNVLERRGELALLRAVGYRRGRLAQLVLLENVVLLVTGLLTGIVAASLAVLPHKLLAESPISWLLLRDLAMMLGAVLLAGLLSSLVTIRAVLRLPLVASLRGE